MPLNVVLTHDLIAVLHPLATSKAKDLGAAFRTARTNPEHICRVFWIEYIDVMPGIMLCPSIGREDLDRVVESGDSQSRLVWMT